MAPYFVVPNLDWETAVTRNLRRFMAEMDEEPPDEEAAGDALCNALICGRICALLAGEVA